MREVWHVFKPLDSFFILIKVALFYSSAVLVAISRYLLCTNDTLKYEVYLVVS